MQSVRLLINNLEIIDNLDNIIDIELLKRSIFIDLENKRLQKKI